MLILEIMRRLKGLRRYIRKHGKHFTEELAYDAVFCKWDAQEVQESTQKMVYYNITGATMGDMLYLMNKACIDQHRLKPSKMDCIKKTLKIVGDYKEGQGYAFKEFIEELTRRRKDFNFLPYI